ncbi:MAG: hypothetical protein M0R33_24060, partial [Methylomonas sp.]|uniref:RHS repeat domain-containing protein n=1 Tax=Methylomonas sp. TaxID=418 RepID=UPI002600B435
AEGRITTFKYDDLGRVIEIVDPLVETPTDKTQTFAYDEAGNVIEATDRKGQTSRYSYDRLNRNTQIDHLADGSQEAYTYDVFGDLIQSQNADVTYTYTYTSKHQLQSKTDSRASKTLSWTYDPAGNIDTKTDFQGDITTYQYDSANRLVAETNPAYLQVSYHYDGAGRLIDRILSNGAITHYGWDAAGRLTQLKNTTLTGGLVNDTGYTRDRLGNILSQTETNSLGQVTGTTNYSYDPAYRLLSADYPGTAFDESFTYDKVGNRKTHTQGSLAPNANTRYYAYDAGNRLNNIRIGSTGGSIESAFSYDDNGSLIQETGPRAKTITWDANNRVKQINGSQYRYDPKGYRIEKTGSLTNRYYLEGEHLEAVYDGNGALRDQYMRGTVIDEVVNGYHRDANNVMVNSTYHHDALQSVLGQSAHDGQLQSTQSYTAFGNLLSGTGTSNTLQKYTGRELDGESGCYYYRARIYCPELGRFISADPLGFKAGVNFYVYVNNNPVNANDPSGNICVGCMVLALANTPVGQALSDPAYYQLLGDHAGQFANGVISYPRGIVRAVDYGTQLMGLQGDALQSRSQVNLQILNTLTNQAIQNPDVALNFATDYAAQNVSQVAGRFYAGIGTGLLFPNTYQGKLTSLGLSGTAMFGDAMNAINNGVNTLQGLIPPVLGAPVTPSINFNLNIQTSSSNSLSNTISNYLGGNFANGGFVLYPNKSNTNMMAQVYKK